jgi:hypothetical protein
MCDLEDKILKKNIPGKYTWWEEEERDMYGQVYTDSECSDEEAGMSEMQKVQKWEKAEMPKPLQMTALANLRATQSGAKHTGPKGVIEDHKQAKKQMELNYEIEQQYKEALVEAISNGVHLLPGQKSISANAVKEEMRRANLQRDDSDVENDEEEDYDFLEQYREERLKQMRYATHFPIFGEIKEVDPFEFVDEVDNEDPRVAVIVHMYEPYIKACKDINKMLEVLARRMPFAKFLRLHAHKANANFDPIGLPVIMVHRGGELIHNFTRVTDDLPPDFKEDDVMWLLENAGVVDPENEANHQEPTREADGGEDYRRKNHVRSTVYSDSDEDSELDAYCEGL